MTINRKILFLIIGGLVAGNISISLAAPGRILDDIEAEQADTAALNAETKVFDSIGMGIALSLAQCEEQDQCLVIDANEIEQLIGTLDERINDLILRQNGGKGEFTDILTVYVDQRESYLKYQEELEELIGITADTGAGLPEEDTAFSEEPVESETTSTGEVDLSVFEDADENLDELFKDDLNDLEDLEGSE